MGCVKQKEPDPTQKEPDPIPIEVYDQFLFVGKNTPLIYTSSKEKPKWEIIDAGETGGKTIGTDTLTFDKVGVVKVKVTVEHTSVEKSFEVVNPSFKPISMTVSTMDNRKLGYSYNDGILKLIGDTIGYGKRLALFPDIIKSSVLYIENAEKLDFDNTGKFTERIILRNYYLTKTGSYKTEKNPKNDSIMYKFTYRETASETKEQSMVYSRIGNSISAKVRGAMLLYERRQP